MKTVPPPSPIKHKFYGYKMTQNPSRPKLALYVGSANAKDLADIVSVDNEVKWDSTSNIWKDKGRNRSIIDDHYKSILEFLSGDERILPSSIVIAAEPNSFQFKPMTGMNEINQTLPGIIELTGNYYRDPVGNPVPVGERDRGCWVLDGQHRIKAFREWSSADPYPVNVIIIKSWNGSDYEDSMRHQTYELNMGRELDNNFKASIRERYNAQIGHAKYKQEIGLSWIRTEVEQCGDVFSSKIIGAPKLRPGHIITMHSFEQIILTAYNHDSYLNSNFDLEDLKHTEVKEIATYLYNFFDGVRQSIGLINPLTRGSIGTDPTTSKAIDYWEIATKTDHPQKLLHGVGLKALVRKLLHEVMNESPKPKSPSDVAKLLDHMRGIPWHSKDLISRKDDWVPGIAEALLQMYNPPSKKQKGTKGGKKFNWEIKKTDKKGNTLDNVFIECNGW
jgi:DGQHR domain-containing protein